MKDRTTNAAHLRGPASTTTRLDASTVKRSRRIADVVAAYGIGLVPAGRALIGRCPFHPDGGRPNLHVYTHDERWWCYRCAIGGDVLDFVARIEGVGFREAIRIVAGNPSNPAWRGAPAHLAGAAPVSRVVRSRDRSHQPLEEIERACLGAAAELYANRLLTEPEARAYLEARGLDRATLGRYRVGYASGRSLTSHLRWRGLSPALAVRTGLLYPSGEERLSGRIVVPELRDGTPVWMVGRALHDADESPKYLGLPGSKPLLGWEHAVQSDEVVVVEGVFDLLTLGMWGIPAVALVGTHASRKSVDDLRRFRRVYVALDADPAGQSAAATLIGQLSPRAVPVRLPAADGVKDVADLAPLPGGHAAFRAALADAASAA